MLIFKLGQIIILCCLKNQGHLSINSFTFYKIKDDFELENIALWLMQYASFPLEIITAFGLDLSNDTFKDKELSKSEKILKGIQTLYFSLFYINCSLDWS